MGIGNNRSIDHAIGAGGRIKSAAFIVFSLLSAGIVISLLVIIGQRLQEMPMRQNRAATQTCNISITGDYSRSAYNMVYNPSNSSVLRCHVSGTLGGNGVVCQREELPHGQKSNL